MQSFSLRGAAAPPAGATGKGQAWSQDTPPRLWPRFLDRLIFWRQDVVRVVFTFPKYLKMALASCVLVLQLCTPMPWI